MVVIAGRNESGKVWGGVIALTFSTVKCHSHYVARRLGNDAATACSDIFYVNQFDALFQVEIPPERNHMPPGEERRK